MTKENNMKGYIVTHYFQDDVESFPLYGNKELFSYLKTNGVKELPFLIEDLDSESMEVALPDGTTVEIEEMACSDNNLTEVVFDGNSYVSIKDYATEHNCSTRKVRYAIGRRYLKYIRIETFAHKTITLVDRNGLTTRRHPPYNTR